MGDKGFAMYDGTYLLLETDTPNVFVFLREDGKPLGDYGDRPLEMYQAYLIYKKQIGDILPKDDVAKNVFYEDIEGVNAMRLWVYTLGKEPDFIKAFMHGGMEGGNLIN